MKYSSETFQKNTMNPINPIFKSIKVLYLKKQKSVKQYFTSVWALKDNLPTVLI